MIHNATDDAANILKDFHQHDFGSDGLLEFPTTSRSINAITVHPRLLNAVGQLLGTDHFNLKQADLWKKVGVPPAEKYGAQQNTDQRIHMDYPNHSMVHPPKWERHEALEMIIYFSDSKRCGGSTAVIPREGPHDAAYQWPYMNMPGVCPVPYINDKQTAERKIKEFDPEMHRFRQSLYEREKYVQFVPGTVLFYRYDVWHRGTPLKVGETRWTQNMAFARDDCDWVGQWQRSTTYFMYGEVLNHQRLMEELMGKLTPFQRSVIGFPRPGSPYWNTETIEAVEKRYERWGVDMTPYRMALGHTSNISNLRSKL